MPAAGNGPRLQLGRAQRFACSRKLTLAAPLSSCLNNMCLLSSQHPGLKVQRQGLAFLQC